MSLGGCRGPWVLTNARVHRTPYISVYSSLIHNQGWKLAKHLSAGRGGRGGARGRPRAQL